MNEFAYIYIKLYYDTNFDQVGTDCRHSHFDL
jgi:hypothetical protein